MSHVLLCSAIQPDFRGEVWSLRLRKTAPSLSADVAPIDARDAMRAITEFAGNANNGLIVTPSAYSAIFRERIIALVKLPAIYFSPFFAARSVARRIMMELCR